MDLKKLTLVAVLAVSQAAAAVPAFAEAVNNTPSNTTVVGTVVSAAPEVMPESTDPLPPLPTETAGRSSVTDTNTYSNSCRDS